MGSYVSSNSTSNYSNTPVTLSDLTNPVVLTGSSGSQIGGTGNVGGNLSTSSNISGSTFNSLDGGAISSAFGLADKSVAGVLDFTAKLFTQNQLNTKDFYNQVSESSKDALDYVSTYANKEGEQSKFLQNILYGGAGLAALYIVLKFSKWGK
jgi:hypothetical protein